MRSFCSSCASHFTYEKWSEWDGLCYVNKVTYDTITFAVTKKRALQILLPYTTVMVVVLAVIAFMSYLLIGKMNHYG